MNIDQHQTPTTYLKSKDGHSSGVMKKTSNFKAILMALGLLVFIGGTVSVFLISQKQDTTPVAPNAPQSQPAAYIEKTQTCTLEFEVTEPEEEKVSCGNSGCTNTDDCVSGYVCVSTSATDDDGNIMKYCADEDYLDACVNNPNQNNCCEAPEENKLECGEKGCDNDEDCEDNLICVDADGNNRYCAKESYQDACADDPDEETCCEAPATVTPTTTLTTTPTVTPTTTVTATPTNKTTTVTPTATVTTIITTVGCNETCKANADCSNVSHICYGGQCRLDVNPTDSQCKLPNGETTIVRPVTVPTQSGPANWANYVKAGLGTLGIGALLLLLL